MRFGQLEVRPDQRQVLVDGRPVDMAARAYDVLWVLVQHRDRVITKNELLDRVWPGVVVEEHNLHTQVSLLRKLIGAKAIATIPGRGYRFVAVADADAEPGRPPGPPAEATSLIGREADLATLEPLLAVSRVLTVCGPGGVGKTTLAHALVERSVATQGADIAWVELSTLGDPVRIPAAIAIALNIGEQTDLTPATLCRALARRRTLVVLDNCEHLVEAVSGLVQMLLDASSAVTFLTTSREPLGLRDEQCYHLQGLACLPEGPSSSDAQPPPALRLLEARARLHDSRFSLAPDQREIAIRLCQTLEGNPLAIEMAASRIRLFGLAGVLDRIGQRLHFLRNAARHPVPRHTSLWATLDWSYSLLSERAQQALRWLSVFAGPFDLECAEQLLHEAGFAPLEATDAVAELVAKSLLAEADGTPPRRRLAETARMFAAEWLTRQEERDRALTHHERVMTRRAGQADEDFWRLSDESWLARYGSDLPDMMEAFARACERGDADAAAALGIGLRPPFLLKGLDAPARQATQRLLGLVPRAGEWAQARIWTFVSSMNPVPVNGISSLESTQKRLALWRAIGNEAFIYDSLCRYASVLAEEGEFARADAVLREVEAMTGPDCPPRRRQFFARVRATVAQLADRPDVAAKQRAALRLATEAGIVSQIARCHILLAESALETGDNDEALAHCKAADEVTLRNNSVFLLPNTNLEVLVYTICGELDEARRAALRALERAFEMGMVAAPANSMALLAARLGHCRESAWLLGAFDAWAQPLQFTRGRSALMALTLAEDAIDRAIGRERHMEERSVGATLRPDQLHALCLALLGAPGATTPAAEVRVSARARGASGRRA
jgi:predicted ATPase/DNA-binding winged helix-turn-helix (wHTH) protein